MGFSMGLLFIRMFLCGFLSFNFPLSSFSRLGRLTKRKIPSRQVEKIKERRISLEKCYASRSALYIHIYIQVVHRDIEESAEHFQVVIQTGGRI